MKLKDAFTLAEVLITLGIIGVVAAITMPLLINHINGQVFRSKLLKYNSVFAQAFEQYMNNNGCVGDLRNCLMFSGEGDHNLLWNELGPYFVKAKDCYTEKSSNCWKQGLMYKYINGSNYTVMDNLSGARAVFPDGAVVRIYDYTGNCTDNFSKNENGILSNVCGWIQLDVNGSKNPNIVGKDVFMWHITKSGIYPFGGEDDIYYSNENGEPGCDPKSSNISAPPREGRGNGCTAKFLINK